MGGGLASARCRTRLCNDRRTLLWFANQRAVEYHPTLVHVDRPDRADPPRARPRPAGGDDRSRWPCGPRTWSARRSPTPGWQGAVKTSGAKGVHVFVPVDDQVADRGRRPRPPARSPPGPSASTPTLATTAFMKEDRGGKVFLDSTRAGGATVVAAYSPRVRPGVPVSFPVRVGRPRRGHARATSPCAPRPACSATRDPWAERMPAPQTIPRRPGRGGPRHPGRPGAGDARGQAPGPRPAQRRADRSIRGSPRAGGRGVGTIGPARSRLGTLKWGHRGWDHDPDRPRGRRSEHARGHGRGVRGLQPGAELHDHQGQLRRRAREEHLTGQRREGHLVPHQRPEGRRRGGRAHAQQRAGRHRPEARAGRGHPPVVDRRCRSPREPRRQGPQPTACWRRGTARTRRRGRSRRTSTGDGARPCRRLERRSPGGWAAPCTGTPSSTRP